MLPSCQLTRRSSTVRRRASSRAPCSGSTARAPGPSTRATSVAKYRPPESTSSVLPSATTRPDPSSTQRSASSAANSTSWVATSTALPRSAKRAQSRRRARPSGRGPCRASARRARPPRAASPPPMPRPASTIASARRWRSPPERSRGSASAACERPTSASAATAQAPAAARRARARAGSSRPGSGGPAPRLRRPRTVPRSGERSPAATRSRVLLPAPLRPSRATVSPGSTRRLEPAQRRQAGARAVVVLDPDALELQSAAAPARRGAQQTAEPLGALRRTLLRCGDSASSALPHRRVPATAASARASLTPIGSGRRPASAHIRAAGGASSGARSTAQSTKSAGGRRRRSAPRSSTTTRSAAARQRSTRCSASSTVVPHSSFSRRSCQISSSPATGSSCEVGSSSSSSRGCVTSAAPSATRCSSPPESVCDRAVEQAADAERERRLLDRPRGGRRPSCRGSRAAARAPPRPSFITTCDSGSWNSEAATAATPPGPHARGVEPADGDAARELAAVEVRHEAGGGAQQRRLAARRGVRRAAPARPRRARGRCRRSAGADAPG